MNSFIGEFLIISGAYETEMWLGAMAIWGVALGTAYIVWLYYRVVMGKTNAKIEGMNLELNAREIATLAPLVLLVLYLGLQPDLVLSYLHAPVTELLTTAGVTQ